ncbi:hypothetical protein AOLI_G00179390 [Acnodon oligacanthus]
MKTDNLKPLDSAGGSQEPNGDSPGDYIDVVSPLADELHTSIPALHHVARKVSLGQTSSRKTMPYYKLPVYHTFKEQSFFCKGGSALKRVNMESSNLPPRSGLSSVLDQRPLEPSSCHRSVKKGSEKKLPQEGMKAAFIGTSAETVAWQPAFQISTWQSTTTGWGSRSGQPKGA